jgi:tetratricopeptide (TPR) repeat protein
VLLLSGIVARDGIAQALPDEATRFQLADTYARAGQFDRAIPLLESLYAENPDYGYFSRLISALESTKRYSEAITLIDTRAATEESPVSLLSQKARLLYMDRRTEEAAGTWQAAISAAPQEELTYRLVYQSIADVREFRNAVDVLLQGRGTLGDSTLFAGELGYLYGMLSEHASAMTEYMSLIKHDDRQLSNVKSRLGRVADQPGVVAASVEIVERGVRAEPLNRAYRELLGWLFLEAGLFRPALDAYRAIDRLESEQGRVLFTFAGQAAAAEAFDVALEAYSEILKDNANRPIAAEALRGKAEMHQLWADALRENPDPSQENNKASTEQYKLAQKAFEEYAEKYPASPNYPYVLLEVARLNQEVFFRIEPAREILETIISRFPSHAAADRAEYQYGLLLLSDGDLDGARLQFGRLEERLRTGDLAEAARYQIAMIHFYRGEFAAADALVGALKENTSNDTANDAIEMRVLLVEGRGPDSLSTPLREFAKGQMLVRQRKFDAAFEAFGAMQSNHAGHALADDAMFEQAELLVMLDRIPQAYQLYAELPLRHPTSHLADRSLFEAANLQEVRMNNVDKAIELYNRVMLEYPGSILAGEARLRIRALRGDNV